MSAAGDNRGTYSSTDEKINDFIRKLDEEVNRASTEPDRFTNQRRKMGVGNNPEDTTSLALINSKNDKMSGFDDNSTTKSSSGRIKSPYRRQSFGIDAGTKWNRSKGRIMKPTDTVASPVASPTKFKQTGKVFV